MLEEFEQQVRNAVPDPWEGQIFTLSDAFKPREPLKYLIDGLLPEGSLSIVFGAPASFKSLVLGDAVVHVAVGHSWLGRSVIQSPVLWVDLDNGKRRTHGRFEALARELGISEEPNFHYVSMPTPFFNAGNSKDVTDLEQRIRLMNIKLVVIDNLGIISSGVDENSDQMITIMGNLRCLAEKTGAAIVIIHHQRKYTGKGRAGETLRGHSLIAAAIDLALLVTREEGSDTLRIKSTKDRDVEVLPIAADFTFEHKIGTKE